MNIWKKVLAVIVLAASIVLIAAPVAAQDEAASERAVSNREIEVRMHEAERQLEAAAQRIAEISSERLARAGEFERRFMVASTRPLLGITIGSEGDKQPVEGVAIVAISPGGAAAEADLRSGDIITAINGESLSSGSATAANSALLEFMEGVEAGDVLDVEYLRDSKTGTAEVKPTQMSSQTFDFDFGFDPGFMPNISGAPHVKVFAWTNRHGAYGFGEMELVELNESLGRYFGTDSGLLIIKAPKDNAYKLLDGDVIKSIDGRIPNDLSHAMRILSSYQSGETLNIEIMRDKRKKTLTVEVPDNQRSHEFRVPSVAPVFAPAPNVRVVRKVEERT